jgi:hypothetical protein
MMAWLFVIYMIRSIGGGVENPCTMSASTRALIGLNPRKLMAAASRRIIRKR